MSKPTVSFVVLTWNSQQFIADCLESIFACESFVPRVFVVDNGSTDSTKSILYDFQRTYPSLVCTMLSENKGTTVSRNLALRDAVQESDYVCVLDSDTVVNDYAIAEMIEAIRKHPDIGVVGPTMCNSSGEEQLSGRNLPSIGIKLRKAIPFGSFKDKGAHMELPNTPIVDGLQDVPYLLSACWLMPVSTLEKVGLLDERIFYAPEDVDYCVRVHQAGLRVVRCWNARIIHEYQRLSHKKLVSKTNIEHIKGLAYYFKKYGYLFDSSKALRSRIGFE